VQTKLAQSLLPLGHSLQSEYVKRVVASISQSATSALAAKEATIIVNAISGAAKVMTVQAVCQKNSMISVYINKCRTFL